MVNMMSSSGSRTARPLDEERDTNFDGKKDVFIHYDERGNPEKIEEDTRHKRED